MLGGGYLGGCYLGGDGTAPAARGTGHGRVPLIATGDGPAPAAVRRRALRAIAISEAALLGEAEAFVVLLRDEHAEGPVVLVLE